MNNMKNIIIASVENIFTELYIDTLTKKCGIDSENIIVASFDDQNLIAEKKLSVKAIHYKDIEPSEIQKCNTITIISLHNKNSAALRYLIDNYGIQDRTYIHLTDDEVDRWLKTKNKYGNLIPAKNNFLDENCIYALHKVKNIIAPKPYFSNALEKLVPDQNFVFHDCRDAFKSMKSQLWDQVASIYQKNKNESRAERTICIGAKQGAIGLKDTLNIIKALVSENVIPEHKILIFTNKRKKYFRVFIDIYLGYLRHIKKKNIDAAYPTTSNVFTYNAIIMSCNNLILQGRGSMSTARSYIAMGRGAVHVKAGSPNHIELTEAERVDVLSYDSFEKLAKNFKRSSLDLENNKDIMNKRFKEKYSVLEKIYNA
ncbi:hypothetical protein [Oceanospirillum sanctuarii]|uniref:hypothetical protein n=1 Tax=Oceanospirillum sanctuarii TaxID=1434821 RepID=UPI000A3B7A37|nr:hypothetical protein [Oceanospirillum sanctuarii]